MNIILTGPPRIGKTTIVQAVLSKIEKDCAGFYTEEIRENQQRVGFRLVTLDNRSCIMAHKNFKSSHRVGKYGVDIQGFDEFLGVIEFFDPSTDLIVIDEIGKMESLSVKFNSLLIRILDSETPVIATIGLKGAGIIEQIKHRPDIRLFEI